MMKILLLGEYSGLHKNLQKGLSQAGHKVDLASNGDGFKKIFGNIPMPQAKSQLPWHRRRYKADYFSFLSKFSGYDVVQLINVDIFFKRKFDYKKSLEILKKNNGKIFLLAAGSDAVYWQKSRLYLDYGPFEDELKYDVKKNKVSHQTKESYDFNMHIAKNVDGIIPVMYEYAVGYRDFPNTRPTIPLPIDLDSIQPNFITRNKKKLIYHGLTRYGFKGTRHVEKAFCWLNQNYGKSMHCEIFPTMPLQKHLKNLRLQDIVVDQVNSYSYGMNAIYAAALGKVVLSGAEPECLQEFGVNYCPIINATPSPEDIREILINIVEDIPYIHEIGEKSRQYVKEVHCCKKIAAKYLKEWQRE